MKNLKSALANLRQRAQFTANKKVYIVYFIY